MTPRGGIRTEQITAVGGLPQTADAEMDRLKGLAQATFQIDCGGALHLGAGA